MPHRSDIPPITPVRMAVRGRCMRHVKIGITRTSYLADRIASLIARLPEATHTRKPIGEEHMLEWLTTKYPAASALGGPLALPVAAGDRPGSPPHSSWSVTGTWMSQSDQPHAATEVSADALLAAVYSEYSAALHTYAYHLLNNQEDADDVVQEVFIRAHSHLIELRDPARLKSWLYRIATNLCMDHLRRRSRVRRVLGIALPLASHAEDNEQYQTQDIAQPGSTDAIDGVAERDHIGQALRKMPPKYATCLLLHSIQGLSYREIADVLGLTPGAAAVRLSRARDLFGKCYDELKGGEQR
jgi:RNA polymerase sigma-70 factor, ECF subfamily